MRRLLFGLSLLCLSLLSVSSTAFAYEPFDKVCSGNKTGSSAVCTSRNPGEDPISGDHGLIYDITNIIAFAAGAAAVIMIIVSGIRYMTAGGDSGKISSAKNTLVGALIGLAVIVLARSIIIFVIGRF